MGCRRLPGGGASDVRSAACRRMLSGHPEPQRAAPDAAALRRCGRLLAQLSPGRWGLAAEREHHHSQERWPSGRLLPASREKFSAARSRACRWDPAVPATSNVATTAAGVEDLLPVRAAAGTESLADSLAKLGLKLQLDLAGKFTGSGLIPDSETRSTGSAKCDAYLWAKARYLDTGRANARCLGYWLDAFWLKHPGRMPWWENCLSNHDWIVRNRGFLFDLSNWGDESPQDDPGQPVGTDLETFRAC